MSPHIPGRCLFGFFTLVFLEHQTRRKVCALLLFTTDMVTEYKGLYSLHTVQEQHSYHTHPNTVAFHTHDSTPEHEGAQQEPRTQG